MNYYKTLIAITWKSSFTKHATFFTEAISMLINNIGFFALWWIFFKAFPRVGTWTFQDVAALYAILSISCGISSFSCGGARLIPYLIASNDLDRFLLRPKNILLSILFSKSYPRGAGDIISSIFYVVAGAIYDPVMLFKMFCFSILIAFVLVAVRVITATLSFWAKGVEEISEKYFDCVMIFSLYPTGIYPYLFRFVMFTVFPAGFISFLPIELLHEFSLGFASLFFGGTIFFTWLAFFLFYRGLKRYESGYSF